MTYRLSVTLTLYYIILYYIIIVVGVCDFIFDNGHYCLIDIPTPYNDVPALCDSHGGRMVIIQSAEEKDYLQSQLSPLTLRYSIYYENIICKYHLNTLITFVEIMSLCLTQNYIKENIL